VDHASHDVRRTITVVASDLKGSTELGEKLDAEAVREILALYFDAMRLVFESHGGMIHKIVGDAIIVVFGLPTATGDDAGRAVRAAAALLHGIAMTLSPGAVIAIRAERKPVLLRGKDGEVKRDFIMLALGHAATLSAADQQRMLQGADPGPLGEGYRLVREMGGFVRFAPLPGGALETRVFLPAA
jgi:class 3 adenylate cyclase